MSCIVEEYIKIIMKCWSSHRTLYCYFILILWIFVLVAGLYKYVGRDDVKTAPKLSIIKNSVIKSISPPVVTTLNTKRVKRLCNFPENINAGTEGEVHSNYTLEGVVILLRHGDRGPLSHVRNVSKIQCSPLHDVHLKDYMTFFKNSTPTPELLHFLGHFQNFPLTPVLNDCTLGQLTYLGVSQLIKIGKLLHNLYWDKLIPSSSSISSENIVIYSTRYRRTFQSALAFLFSFIDHENLLQLTLKESQSLSFCFNDCTCPAAETYRKQFNVATSQLLKTHPAVGSLVKYLSAIVFETEDKTSNQYPSVIEDGLLCYLCHKANLPCQDTQGKKNCVSMENVNNLLAYTEWEQKQYLKNQNLLKSFMLLAYGLIRNIVSHILQMISEKKLKFVIYSGHDKTLQYIMHAFGIADGSHPPYASRLIFELYRDSTRSEELHPNNYFFRIVYNGKDLTKKISFCRKTAFPVDNNDFFFFNDEPSKHRYSYLCRIERIIRFLHDDYFFLFNGTNFKDVCFPNAIGMSDPIRKHTM